MENEFDEYLFQFSKFKKKNKISDSSLIAMFNMHVSVLSFKTVLATGCAPLFFTEIGGT